MLEQLRNGMAFREDLWVVGAQNAGKSSLIAAMQRAGAGGGGGGGSAPAPVAAATRSSGPLLRAPTIAPVPGTTLGVLRVPGVPLGAKQRVFDTPGVPHDHQLACRWPRRPRRPPRGAGTVPVGVVVVVREAGGRERGRVSVSRATLSVGLVL